jgi:hypothetical protein
MKSTHKARARSGEIGVKPLFGAIDDNTSQK